MTTVALRTIARRWPAPPQPKPPMPMPSMPLSINEKWLIAMHRALSPATRDAFNQFMLIMSTNSYQLGDVYERSALVDAFMDNLPEDVADGLRSFLERVAKLQAVDRGELTEDEAYPPDPDDYRDETYYGALMSGACWFNAVKPKLKCAGWKVVATYQHDGQTCAHCGAVGLVSADWVGPNHDRHGDDFRTFKHCLCCDRAAEYLYIRNCQPIPTDRPIYNDNPLTTLDAQPINREDA